MHVYSCGVVHTENFHRSTSKKIIERQVVQQNLQIISYGFKYWQVLKPLLSYLPTEISVSDILIFNVLAEHLLKYHKKVKTCLCSLFVLN